MKTFKPLVVAALLLTAGSVVAHHSYGMYYDLQQAVILKGKVTKVAFKAPHVLLTIETKNSGTWTAEWTNLMALARAGVDENTIHLGDVLEIEACPSRDPDSRAVSALIDVKRASDGWHWSRDVVPPGPRVIE